tara:strand:- start:74073 stop:75503 length:1431 start_codon:yes stop_codon:yes gene_type:complete
MHQKLETLLIVLLTIGIASSEERNANAQYRDNAIRKMRQDPTELNCPNIVFIVADDLGYGDLGCYGCADIKTPNLDRLAESGTRFTHFYANSSTCSPTRAAFLTGRYPQRIGLDNALYYQEFGRGLEIDGRTIAHAMREAGYQTGISGKWHVGYDFERQPRQQGFDHFFGLLGGNHHYFEHMDRIGVDDLWLNDQPVARIGYTTDLLTDDSIEFIRRNQDQPFFLYLPHVAPHFPFQGPDDQDKVVQPKKKNWQEGDRATYVSMVESMDAGIGRTLAEIDRLGLREKTLVVFSSDNGADIHGRNAPLSGLKSTIWEGGIRVCCIARWPGHIPGNQICEFPCATFDWTATIRSFTGQVSKHDEGINLLPYLTAGEAPADRELFWRRKSGPKRSVKNASRTVRSGDWKLLEFVDGPAHLFDVRKDPSEQNDVIDDHPDIAKRLAASLDRWEESIEASLQSHSRESSTSQEPAEATRKD